MIAWQVLGRMYGRLCTYTLLWLLMFLLGFVLLSALALTGLVSKHGDMMM